MLVENVTIDHAAYGIYRPWFDNHEYRNLQIAATTTEPFNRGLDDKSLQYGSITVDGLTFAQLGYGGQMPLIQISANNVSGTAESHFRNVTVSDRQRDDRWPLVNLGGNRDIFANSRMAIDQARLLTLKAAWALDTRGTFGALTDISAIKVIAPNVLQSVTDAAMQIHGGEGMSDPELSWLFVMGRALRLADGPDEVHRGMVARLELAKYK